MRVVLGAILSVYACVAHAAEQPWHVVEPEAIRSHTEFLADDLLEGRAAASRGYDLAAAYVAAQFRQYGMTPFGEDDSFFQTVPLIEATPVLPGSSARFVFEDEARDFEYGTDYLPSADFLSASSTLSAPLVFAGHGIDAPELDFDDFEDIEVEGRIAVILSGAPPTFPNDQRAYYSSELRKWTTLSEKGAVGAVVVPSTADAQRFPWERTVAMSWAPQMRWLDAEGNPQDAYPDLKLRFKFNHSAAAELFEHAPTSLEEALNKSDAGEAQGFELPGMLTLSATTGLRRTESANVIAIIEGSDPQVGQESIVVSAHLDHLGRGSIVDGDSTYNGAHDNAVGVGILLEMARALNRVRARPRRSIIFAAVTAEEKGLLGSAFFVQNVHAGDRTLVANLNIEMPLLLAQTYDLVALGAEHSTLGAAARRAASAQGYRLSADAAPEEVGFIRGDQFSFVRSGVPAILLHAGYQARDASIELQELQRTFRETHYHQPSDDISLPIDYRAAADLARIYIRIALEAANGASPPRWRRGDFFADKFAPGDDE